MLRLLGAIQYQGRTHNFSVLFVDVILPQT